MSRISPSYRHSIIRNPTAPKKLDTHCSDQKTEIMEAAKCDLQIPTTSLMQLPQADSVEYVKRMAKTSGNYDVLHRHFTKAGLTFHVDRAKVYVYTTGPSERITPNIIGIIPSYIVSSAADPFHVAASLVVHHGGFAIAGSVRVEHNPFRISEFTVHEVKEGDKLSEFTIRADQLSSLSAAEVNKFLGRPPITERHKWSGGGVLGPGEQATVASVFFHEVSQDKYVRSFYPPSGLDALKAQIPLMQKFAAVNYLRYQGVFETEEGKGTSFCTSTSCSCNICTSCSCSSFSHVAEAE